MQEKEREKKKEKRKKYEYWLPSGDFIAHVHTCLPSQNKLFGLLASQTKKESIIICESLNSLLCTLFVCVCGDKVLLLVCYKHV